MAGWPARAVRVVLCGMLVGALVVGVGSLGAVGSPDAVPSSESAFETGPPVAMDEHETNETDDANGTDDANDTTEEPVRLEDFDRVQTTFDVVENGTAAVTVVYRYALGDNESATEWEALVADIDDRPDAYVAAEEQRWNATLADAKNGTDREMTLSGFSVETDEVTTPRTAGTVTFTFTWTGFATVEPKWIGVGDALAQYTLDEGTTLWIYWPESYDRQTVSPEPDHERDGHAVGWDGERTEFIEDEPWVELLEEGEPAGETGQSDRFGMFGLALLVAVLLGVTGAAVWWHLRTSDDAADLQPDPFEEADQRAPPSELLSNEERVLTLLSENGGRMKQQAVVSELDWTEAKTSQVVGDLRESGDIEVFRLGRENVLALPDHDDVTEDQ